MAQSLLEWIRDLLDDPDARDAFLDDPNGYAADHGFHNLSGADVYDALCLIADNDHGHYPAPRHYDHDGDDHDGATYLKSYVNNNYTTIEDHSTNIDNSIHQNIDTDGGDFNQVIDNDPVVASGDGAVAAGGDIRDSTVTTGNGNVVGDNNQAVTGDDNTSSFGSGDATSSNIGHASFGDGGSMSVGGDSHGYNSDNDTNTSVHNSGDGDTAVNVAGDHGYADQGVDQSHTDNSDYSNYEDNSRSDSHDDVGSHNEVRDYDSHDTDIVHT
ncbi:hypothetical protein GCM10023321_22530 [Pseudonocardia eucalypti]|uniref:Dentin sialophosphoprotein n=1 Tax=Pseudonocardia eucalypti TaxID=648755 RepID=A0ABP9Q2G7_9PSEU|nr:hypothetical protein [Pseudonocardia eucalypti]